MATNKQARQQFLRGVHTWNLDVPQEVWEALLRHTEGHPKGFVILAIKEALERNPQRETTQAKR